MKISKVIITSTLDKTYLDYWPIVEEAWRKLEIEPILYLITDKKYNKVQSQNFYIKKIHPVFIAQNLRMLIPAIYPDDVCLLSDIDMMPLSKDYFQGSIKDIEDNNFFVYRANATPDNMLPICWNVALGSTWSEVFSIKNLDDITSKLIEWYPKNYKPYKKNWYVDQIKLKEYLSIFELSNSNRVVYRKDEDLNFKRLNRDSLEKDFAGFKNEQGSYVDFHMPRPFLRNQALIDEVLNLNFLQK